MERLFRERTAPRCPRLESAKKGAKDEFAFVKLHFAIVSERAYAH